MMDIYTLVQVAEHEARRTGQMAYIWIKSDGQHKGWAVDTDIDAYEDDPTFFLHNDEKTTAHPLVMMVKPR